MAGSKGGQGQGPGSGKRKQSLEKVKYVSKNKVRQAKCRVCQKELASQNYSRHLQEKHSEVWKSNKGDLREWGDQPLNFFNPRPAATVREEDQPGEDHHGEESDLDLDLSRSGSDRSRSPLEAAAAVEREVEAESLELPDIQNDYRERGRSLTRSPPLVRRRRSNSSPHYRVQDINRINGSVDAILQKLNLAAPNVNEKTAVEKVLTKLEVVKAGIKVGSCVKEIKSVTEKLEELFVDKSPEEECDQTNTEDLFLHCRSIEDIEIKAAEFKYVGDFMKCLVCDTKFSYGSDQPRDFGVGGVQSSKFRNLKKIMRRHLQSAKHSDMLEKSKRKEEIEFKEMTRNKKISLTLGRIVYKNLYHGAALSLYPVDVAMLAKEGVDIGELNHSKWFSAKFGSIIGEVIRKRVTAFLSTALPQTGLRPPTKVVADKATHKHWSNNLTGVLTIVPGADQLIQGIFLAAPRCERSTGEALSEDIKETLCSFMISPCQVTGLAGDGAYTHCSVGDKLDEKLGIQGFHDTDFCHIAGRQDINLRELEEFQWVTKFVLTVSKTNKFVNWGQAWHIFFKVCND